MENSQILKRWAEYLRTVLNCSSVISDAAIDRFPHVDTNNDLDLPFSLTETIRAVQHISNGKALGSDPIPPDVYKHGCANFGIIINTAKMVVIHQPPTSAEYNAPRINDNGTEYKNVENFAYLGSTLEFNTRIDDEVAQRISLASYAFGQLQASMWNCHGFHLNTKL
ncbi:unnamed protein product [Schistocephalus solidus]|uniref:Uncharacterized protein n=1 Tax=Schistocephalus solidus TaxID=70667 RepID=A0A183SJ78_SCHSO|nr:unnamed protein product [Schistocephalus solidus]